MTALTTQQHSATQAHWLHPVVLDRLQRAGVFLDHEAQRIASGAEPVASGCWEWKRHVMPNGYGQVGHRGRAVYAHRLMLAIFQGVDQRNSLNCCHRCDNRKCVNPDHLYWAPQIDNMRDAVNKGRMSTGWKVRGEDSGNSKLTESDVRAIRGMTADGSTKSELAARFRCDRTTISHILRGKTWNHVA